MPRYSSTARLPSISLTADLAASTFSKPGRNLTTSAVMEHSRGGGPDGRGCAGRHRSILATAGHSRRGPELATTERPRYGEFIPRDAAMAFTRRHWIMLGVLLG